MNRRSQKRSFNWEQFSSFGKQYPMPRTKIYHQMYKSIKSSWTFISGAHCLNWARWVATGGWLRWLTGLPTGLLTSSRQAKKQAYLIGPWSISVNFTSLKNVANKRNYLLRPFIDCDRKNRSRYFSDLNNGSMSICEKCRLKVLLVRRLGIVSIIGLI